MKSDELDDYQPRQVGGLVLALLGASLGGYVLVRRGRGHRARGAREWRVNVRRADGETTAAGRDLVDVLTRALGAVRTRSLKEE